MEKYFIVKQKTSGVRYIGDVAEMMALSPLVLDSAPAAPRSNSIIGNVSNILRADTGSLSGGLSRELLDFARSLFVARFNIIVKKMWQAKNCGLFFVEEYDSKVAYDYNNGDNIEDGIVHKGLPFRFYRPQIDDNRQYSGKNIKSQKIHWFLSFFDNVTDMLKKDTVMAMPIENVSQGFMPVALGINAPTTKEANIIFAPSKKKSETISNLSLSNICQKFTTRSVICQDKERAYVQNLP